MKKKMLFLMAMIAAFVLFVPNAMAADVSSDLATAVSNAEDEDTLKLTDNLEVSAIITINKELTLDLNGFNITFKNNSYLLVDGGDLTVTGKGNMVESVPYYAPILVKGSTDANASNYSVVTVGKDVYLEGWSGVFVKQNSTNTAYGVNITVNGTINAVNDGSDDGEGIGIYINGSIKHTENAPVITLGNTAVIESDGVGIYAAGYAVWNINGATITGVSSGLAIKAGEFNITDATVTATGEDSRPTYGYNNGVKASGSAIQVESNNGYAGNIELNITGGTFTSENGVAVYEYLSKGDENDTTDDTTETTITSIVISGGEFVSKEGNPVLALSDEFVEEHTETGYITGGTFVSGDEETLVKENINNTYIPVESAVTLTLVEVVDGEIGEEISLVITKGTMFDEEKFLASFDEDTMAKEGLEFVGVFADEELETEFDFTEAVNTDTTMYIAANTVEDEELPPKTSDINLVLLIGTIILSVVGTVLVSRKRFAKVN